MENEIAEALRKLHYLIYNDKEWGGRVNILTGDIEEVREGNKTSFPIKPRKESIKGADGWRIFHSHPAHRTFLPSTEDFASVYFCGTPTYILTTWGIWEIRAVNNLDVAEVRRLLRSSVEKVEKECPGRKNDDPEVSWRLEDEVRKVLPVEAHLFAWRD